MYAARVESIKQTNPRNPKADQTAASKLHEENPTPRVFGHVRGLPPGAKFSGRGEMWALNVHGQYLRGIDALKDKVSCVGAPYGSSPTCCSDTRCRHPVSRVGREYPASSMRCPVGRLPR